MKKLTWQQNFKLQRKKKMWQKEKQLQVLIFKFMNGRRDSGLITRFEAGVFNHGLAMLVSALM